MIKVIDGKRYNTDTAEHVYGHDNGRGSSDFRWRTKDLYRTKSGAWFLVHEGGPLTDMACQVAGGLGYGEDLEAITENDAYGFLQAHSTDDKAQEAIDKYFTDRVVDA